MNPHAPGSFWSDALSPAHMFPGLLYAVWTQRGMLLALALCFLRFGC